MHEFLRAVLYRDHVYYDLTVSRIANLYDISTPDGREHFLLPNLIAFIGRSAQSTTTTEGYVDLPQVFAFAQGLGFDPAQVRRSLDRALDKKMLEGNPRFESVRTVTSIRITTIGAYTVTKLARMFTYTDAIVTDTPIVDRTFRSKILNVDSLRDRLERAEIFRNYLDEQWKPMIDKPVTFDWPTVSAAIHKDVDRVARRLPPSAGRA